MSYASALYVGAVTHLRLRPRRHRLRYRIFSMLLDLDELPALNRKLRLFGHNRFALFSFHDADYGLDASLPLKAEIVGLARRAGYAPDGAVLLLTMPRLLGYAFNPLNIYFCHRADGGLEAVVCEVNNTFGQRHAYVMSGRSEAGQPVRSACAKRFYVSPFIGMDLTYDFRIAPPAGRMTVAIRGSDAEGALIDAVHAARRRPLSDRALLAAFLSHPLLPLKVIGGIHWEALRLWLKGVPLHGRPAPPDSPVTIAPAAEGGAAAS